MTTRSERLREIYNRPAPLSMQFIGAATAAELEQLVQRIAALVYARIRHPKDGYTPIKGVDYRDGHTPTPEELVKLIKPLIPKVKDGETPSDERLVELIRPLIPEVKGPSNEDLVALMQPLVQQAINGMPREAVAPTPDELRGVAEPILKTMIAEARKGWFGGGGGGDQVRAGSGVTITTNNVGAKVISATGGSTVTTPTGTVNGSNTSFTVTAEPKYIVADGITYFAGAGYTYAALTVAMDVAPSQYIRAII